MERTLVLLKPDAVQRGLIGRIVARFEQKGLKLAGLELRRFPRELIEEHYAEHREKPFYSNLVGFMTSGPAVAMVVEGLEAIAVVRRLVGRTNSRESEPGTIRGDFGLSCSNNLVHASDGPESAARELALFFPDAREIVEWTPVGEPWVYDLEEELP